MRSSTQRIPEVYPEIRGKCNTHRVIQIAVTRRRCATRLRATCDHSLSHGAARLYVLLDDYSGMKGECWPKQTTIASRLGISRGSVQSYLRELAKAGYLRSWRTLRGNRYLLAYADGWRTPEPEIEQAQIEPAVPASLVEPASLEPAVCPRCAGTGKCEYSVPDSVGYLGNRIRGRRWVGICGCQ